MGIYDLEKSLSFYLFAKPGFNEGMGRVLDIGSVMDIYNENKTGTEADYKALLADWLMVGNDIKNSVKEYEQQLSTNNPKAQ